MPANLNSQSFNVSSAPTQVNVLGIADTALNGIVESIKATNSYIADLEKQVDDLTKQLNNGNKKQDNQSKEAKKDKIASMASDKRTRATQEALYGEVKKNTKASDILKDTLKDGFKELSNILKNNFTKSLKAIDDMTAELRRQKYSTDEIAKYNTRLSAAMNSLSKENFNLSRTEINSYFTELSKTGRQGSFLGDQDLEKYIKLRQAGISESLAQNAALTLDDNTINQIAQSGYDPTVSSTLEKILSGINETNRSFYDNDKQMLTMSLELSKSLTSHIGKAFSPEAIATLANSYAKIKTADLTSLSSDDLTNLLTMTGGKAINSLTPEEYASLIEKAVSSKDKNNIRILSTVLGDEALKSGMNNAYNLATAGKSLGINIADQNTINQRMNDYASGGKISHGIENLTNTLDKMTDGMFSEISAGINEYFGEDLTMEKIVSNGFTLVCTLLSTIQSSELINGGLGKLKSVLGKVMSPTGLAIGAAMAGVSAAVYSVYKTIERQNKPEKLKKEVEKTKDDRSVVQAKLDLAKENNRQDEVDKYTYELAELDAKIKKQESEMYEASRRVTNMKSIAADFSDRAVSENKQLTAELNELRRLQYQAKNTSAFGEDSEQYKQLKAAADAKEAQINDNLQKMHELDEAASNTFWLEGIANFIDISPETLLGWQRFKKSISKFFSGVSDAIAGFFTKTIPEFFTKTIPELFTKAKNTVVNWADGIWQSIKNKFYEYLLDPVFEAFDELHTWFDETIAQPFSEMVDIVGNWLNENVVEPFTNLVNDVGTWLNDNIVQPLLNFATTAGNFITENFVDPLMGFFEFDWLPGPIKKFLGISGSSDEDDKIDIVGDAMEIASKAADKASQIASDVGQSVSKFIDSLKFWADGGVVNKPTAGVIGEAGKEAVLPLTDPSAMANVISQLSASDKALVLKTLLGSGNITSDGFVAAIAKVIGNKLNTSTATNSVLGSLPTSSVPGDDQATINKILSYAGHYSGLVYNLLLHGKNGKYKDAFKQRKKWYEEALANAANQEGRELIKGTYAERALDFGVSQLGKPYILNSLGKIGYVCNELVNAAIKASGFQMGKFRINGVKATFANINKGKMSGKGYPNFRIRDDLTPETATPGMLFFQDGRKNKEGGFQPGHVGLVYYGHQKLHSSGGSSDYTKTGFLPNWQTPCRGVTVTPFDGGSYVIGELPGLFEQASGEFKLPSENSASFGPNAVIGNAGGNQLSDLKKSARESVDAVLATTSGETKKISQEYIDQAMKLINGKNSADIVESLTMIIKYLKDIASSKKTITPVSRPVANKF